MAKLIDIEPIVEEVIFRNFAKFRNTHYFFSLLKEVVPKKIFGIIPTGLEKTIEEAKRKVEQGEELQDALYETGLINKDGYILLKNAIATGNIKEVFEEKINIEKIIKEQMLKTVTAMIFPFLALLGSLVVMYVAIYKLYGQIKVVVNLNGWFYQVLDFFYQDQIRYFFLVLVVLLLISIIVTARYKIPFLKDTFIQLEKMKFYSYLHIGLKAGLNIYELLSEYDGFFRKTVSKILERANLGEDLIKSFIHEFSKFLTPIEKANLASSLTTSDREVLVKAFKDAYNESFYEFQKRFDALSKIITVFIMLLVSSVIYVVFVKIYLQVYSAVNGNLHY